MSIYDDIQALEAKMLDLTYEVHQDILLMKKEKAKVKLASLEILNSEYFDMTKTHYIKKDYINTQYERIFNGCR